MTGLAIPDNDEGGAGPGAPFCSRSVRYGSMVTLIWLTPDVEPPWTARARITAGPFAAGALTARVHVVRSCESVAGCQLPLFS